MSCARCLLRAAAVAVVALVLDAAQASAQRQPHRCPTSTSPPRPAIRMTSSQLQRAMQNFGAASAPTFTITINAGPGLTANPAALAAVRRGADQWARRITTPIVVQLNVDLTALPTGALGGTFRDDLIFSYQEVRAGLVGKAATEMDDAIASSLPASTALSASTPSGITPIRDIRASKGNLKALGFQGLDEMFGVDDARIVLSSNIPFDFDNRDGVAARQFDFETIVAHEIGHALGFLSVVDFGLGTGTMTPLDLFRFEEATAFDPENAQQFSGLARSLFQGRAANFDALETERALSTGVQVQAGGDGRQASHWKDEFLTGVQIGIMTPTFDIERVVRISESDLRAMDLIGYAVQRGRRLAPLNALIAQP